MIELIQLKDERQIIKHVPNMYPQGRPRKWWSARIKKPIKDVLVMADRHYKEFKLKRVYFSGYIPINTENNYLACGRFSTAFVE